MPNRMPALGWSAVPSPNNQMSVTAFAVAAAVVVAAVVAAVVVLAAPTSRRTIPSSAHINAAATGVPDPPPASCARDAEPAAAHVDTGTLTGTRAPAAIGADEPAAIEPARREVAAAGADTTPTDPADPADRALPGRADLGPVFTPSVDPADELDADPAPGPVVSAAASHGIDPTAVPTPRATASAPTRPR